MLDFVRFVPLSQWPASRPRASYHEDAKFQKASGYGQTQRTPLSRTLNDLDRELSQIGARDVIVQIDAANKEEFHRQLRLDGIIRDDTRVRSPAVIVSFLRGTNKNPLVFACDHFSRWHDNLRAIALGLESLRRLERYHIAQAGDQYRGWLALPASTMTTTALSTNGAADALARRSQMAAESILRDASSARTAYRMAIAKAHPDAGGTAEDFQLVQEAKRVLEGHFGATL
jgi:hypothetical protein